MSVTDQRDFARETVVQAAREMANAARTAPKAVGYDRLEIALVQGGDLEELALAMEKMHREGRGGAHFVRDAGNVRASDCCLLIGTRTGPMPGGCAQCAMAGCGNRQGQAQGFSCLYAVHDLGLAVGSAVSMAADKRVDNRVMFSAGAAALELGWLGQAGIAMGIPLSARGKSIYFDRRS